MATIPSVDQFTGCLLGLALGDAVGAPVEAFPPAEAARYVARLSEELVPEPGPGGWSYGQVTDDTQLARELLLTIADRGVFEPEAFAARLLQFVGSGRLIRGGAATLGAAKQLALGLPWHEAGVPAPYAGNGAAMRAGPLGLLYPHDLRLLTRVAVDQARVTHHDPRAIAGSVAMARAVAIAGRRGPISSATFLAEVSAAMEPLDAGFAGTVRGVREWCHLAPADAVSAIAARELEPEALAGWHGISSFVVSSVCWSLYAFLQAPDDFWEAIRVAIRVGGDTDTLAAMTGAISGARLGARALPGLHLARISDGGLPLSEELSALAGRLHQLARGGWGGGS
jgi:poly(ADP-ribose) glycohydrolase ARH3